MFEYLLYRIGSFLTLRLNLQTAYKLAVLISDIRCLFSRYDIAAVTENIQAVFPKMPSSEVEIITRQVFRNFAKYLVDFFRYEGLDLEFIKKYVKVVNIDYLQEASGAEKGVIVVSAHLGNWELGGAVVGRMGYEIWGVALRHQDKRINDFFNSRRNMCNLGIISFENAARRSLAVLKGKGILALVADKDFTKNGGLKIDFFGRPSLLPRGPAALAIKTGAAVLPVFMLRNHDDTFTLSFEKPIFPQRGAKSQEEQLRITGAYKAVIEDYVKRYPDQWYVFRRFWL